MLRTLLQRRAPQFSRLLQTVNSSIYPEQPPPTQTPLSQATFNNHDANHSQALTQFSSYPERPKTALFFPGQGVQRVGMLKPWLEAFPQIVKPILDDVDQTLGINPPLSKLMAEGPSHVLTETENAQPAIFVTSLAIHAVLQEQFGFCDRWEVDFYMGHSLGEFAALVVANNLQFNIGLRTVRARAEAMAECTKSAELGNTFYGRNIDKRTVNKKALGMVALLSEPEYMPSLISAIREALALPKSKSPILDGQVVQISNINSSKQIVLSGHISAINALISHVQKWSGHDPHPVRLNTTTPFHTRIMEPAEEVVRNTLLPRFINPAGVKPVISNISAREFQNRNDIFDLLSRQTTEMVNWAEGVRYLKDKKKVRRWIGIGPGRVGGNLIAAELNGDGGEVFTINDIEDCEKLMKHINNPDQVQARSAIRL